MLNVKKTIGKMLNELGICEQRVLLWTNSGSEPFAAQKVSLDLSGYDTLEIYYYESSTVGRRFAMSMRVSKAQTNILRSYSNMVSGSVSSLLQRQVTINDSGVTFGAGTYRSITANTAPSQGNDAIVPIAIYGIKLAGGGTP